MASITINSNIASLNAQRRLANSTTGLRDAYSSLSSGLRINKASDDAAGLAISSSLSTDRRVYDQGKRNLSDGISLLSIADGALEQLSNIVVRLSELAEQASNGALQTPQRTAINSEAQSLKAEYARITQTTKFNGLNLFSATLGNVRLQSGFGINSILQSDLGGAVGTGTFQSAITASSLTGTSQSVIATDFNGDGFQDLLTLGTSGINNRINVSLGDGEGSFTTVFSSSVNNGPSSSASYGDLNGDGIFDLLLGGSTSYAMLGNGNGTFRSATSFASPFSFVGDSTLADVNNDGILDIGYTGDDGFGEPVQAVMLGNGNGTFRSGTVYASVAVPNYVGVSIAMKDVNGDGNADMFTSYDFSTNGAAMEFRLGDGTGRFGTETTVYTADIDGGKIVLADVNNDKKLDWIQLTQSLDFINLAYIGLGNGDGTFRSPLVSMVNEYSSTGALQTLQVADFNGDGNLDIYGDNSLLIGNGNGTFDGPQTLNVPSATFDSAIADINQDGVLDLISANSSGRTYYNLQTVTSGAAPLLDFSLSTLTGARQALPMFRQKLVQLAAQRGKVGAFESRIGTALSNTATLSLNVASAASQISNVDVATASADLLKQRILQQVGVAVLAQANQGPALALQLLQLDNE